jgi:protein TonB
MCIRDRFGSDFDVVPGHRRSALLLVLAGHGALGALLTMAPSPHASLATPGVLAVSWVGEEPAAEQASPPRLETAAKPRTRPSQRRVDSPPAPSEPKAAGQAAPAPAPVAAAVPATPAEPADGRAEALPVVVAPRFDADYLLNPAPAYPPPSVAAGEQGKVLLRVFVSVHGDAQEVELHEGSGFRRLDRAALDAVRRWRFVPARRGSEAVAAWVVVPISFTLRR